MKKQRKKRAGDFAETLTRFDPRQVRYAQHNEADADLSFSDGANLSGIYPVKGKNPKTTIENTKPEL